MFGGKGVRHTTRMTLAAALSLSAAACSAQENLPDTTKGAQTSARYDSLASRESEIADWLSLRAAALTADSAQRQARYARMTIPAARDRIPWVEAQARERFGDTVGAIGVYTRLGARVNAMRLRVAMAKTRVDSQAVRDELLKYIMTSGGGAVRDGYTLFDKVFRTPTSTEQRAIARSAAAAGYWGRAKAGYAASSKGTSLTSADRFSYATALANTNDDRKAATQFALVTTPVPLAAAASYQRGRALLASGDRKGAMTALRAVVKRFPKDTSAAAALRLLADLAVDDGNDAEARSLLAQVGQRFPSSRYAASARFDAALIAYVLGDARSAVAELTPLATGPDALAAQYWLGRAQEQGGNSNGASAAWQNVIRLDSTSYYAVLAARRLNVHAMNEMRSGDDYPQVPSVDSAERRIALLRGMRMDPEVRYEAERLSKDASASRDRLLATAAVFAGTDQSARAIALGRKALASYGASPSVYRLMYPVTARDTIIAESKANGIDPVLVTALIRQESSFNPSAISPVGARGLMQLMPSVGGMIARSKHITPWSDARLYEPGVNVVLGVAHLAPLLKQQTDVVRALAAYNAGESRVVRWAKRRGADDPEMFTERIPFAETQDYVKSIIRNRAMYDALYTWP